MVHEGSSLPSREDLAIRYASFKTETHGPRGDRTTTCTNLFRCALGDIEESAWYELARKVVASYGDNDLLKRIIAGVRQLCAWLRTEKEREQHALDLYCSNRYQGYLLEKNAQHEESSHATTKGIISLSDEKETLQTRIMSSSCIIRP